MTHIETARYNEVIGLQIGSIREIAHRLSEDCDMEELEEIIAELEETIVDLRGSLAAFPHKHP